MIISLLSIFHFPCTKASPSHWDSEDIIVHDPEGHERHITVDEALDAVMIQSERTRHNSMMGMLGLDPNKLEFDYEKHFPEHELPPDLPIIEEDSIPSGVNLKPRPVRNSLIPAKNVCTANLILFTVPVVTAVEVVSRPNGRSGEKEGRQEALGRRQGKRLRRFWRRGETRSVEEGEEDVVAEDQPVVQEAALSQLLSVHTGRLGPNQRGSNQRIESIRPINSRSKSANYSISLGSSGIT